MESDQKLTDGFSTLIELGNIPSVKLYEIDVTPPGIDGGDSIETTTMRNNTWRTMAPRQLKTLTAPTSTVAYATEVFDTLVAQINVEQRITIFQPDGSTIAFWGFLRSFTPGANTESEMPTATITVQPTNVDPTTGLESAPDYDSDGT